MANGDILSVTIGADGWYADITVAGLNTGGTYAFGLGAGSNPAAGAPKITLTATSLGFDDTGSATTITRTIYGTYQVRQPYPNQALNQETASGGNVTVRVALSDYVYAKDNTGGGNSGTAVTAVFLAGFYTQGGTPSNAASLTATNSSTTAYPVVIANWTWPDGDLVGSTATLRVAAFHASARLGRPVRCVKFSLTDGTNTVTTIATTPAIDSTVGDAVPVTEYIGVLSTATLIQGAVLTANFQAYPWAGDAAAVQDSSAGASAPSPLVGPRTYVCNRTGAYGQSYATVDPVNGNDSTGTVVASGLPTLPYATIFAAFNGLRAYNNTNYSRNNAGGSVMYLANGNHAFAGGTPTLGTAPAAWLTVTNLPSASPVIASQSGGQSLGLRLKITNVSFTAASAIGVISAGAGSWLWLDQCTISSGTNPTFYINTVWHLTRCTISNLAQGISPFSTVNAAPGIIRGNTITDTGSGIAFPYVFTGNLKTGTGGGYTFWDTYPGMTIPFSANTIIAFNRITWGLSANPGIALRAGTVTDTTGVALIQNVLENTANSVVPLLQIAADSSTGTPVNNVLIWYNTVVGQRANLAYNEVDTADGGGLAYRLGWSIKNNIFDQANIKSDTFAGSGYTADSAKVGNWSALFGAAMSGFMNIETTGIGAAGSFLFEYPGLDEDQPPGTGSPPTGTTRAATYPQFVNRQSYNGSTAGAGGGNYRLQTASPAIGLSHDLLLPYDIAGAARTPKDAAGAYAPPGARSRTRASLPSLTTTL